jgi:hypothetical protein
MPQASVELQPALLETRIAPSTLNAEERTVEVVWSRGARVTRAPWFSEPYEEELSLDPKHVRLDRLNNVGPVLDSHSTWSTRSVLGSVTKAWIQDGEGRALLRFARSDEATRVWDLVRDGHVRAVSVGYRVHKFEDLGRKGANERRVLRAVDWEPYEVSFVATPADAGSTVRADKNETNTCQLIRHDEGNHMPPETPIAETTRSTPAPAATPPTVVTPSAADLDAARAEAQKAERSRVSEISRLCETHKVSAARKVELIDSGVTVDAARAKILDDLATRSDASASHSGLRVGEEDGAKRAAAIENALEHRLDRRTALTDAGRELRGYTLTELGRQLLESRGARVGGMDRMELAGMILGRAHSTSDFPKLLANVASKRLMRTYGEMAPTFGPIATPATLPDFKQASRVRLSDAPALQKRNGEGGEYVSGTLDESSATNQLDDFGLIVEFTRKMLINDDLSAFDRVLTSMARRARHLESDLVWALILANAPMADTFALFANEHGNILTGTPLAITGLGSAVEKLRLQTDRKGTVLSIRPKYLICPPALETTALSLVSDEVLPTALASLSPFRGQLTVIIEPRLQTGVTVGGATYAGANNRFFLAGDPADVDMLELATLEGSNGPRLEQELNFRTDGLALKVGHDVGATVLDYRGLVRATAT